MVSLEVWILWLSYCRSYIPPLSGGPFILMGWLRYWEQGLSPRPLFDQYLTQYIDSHTHTHTHTWSPEIMARRFLALFDPRDLTSWRGCLSLTLNYRVETTMTCAFSRATTPGQRMEEVAGGVIFFLIQIFFFFHSFSFFHSVDFLSFVILFFFHYCARIVLGLIKFLKSYLSLYCCSFYCRCCFYCCCFSSSRVVVE